MKFDTARKHEADPYVGLSSESGHRAGAVIEPGISQKATYDHSLQALSLAPTKVGKPTRTEHSLRHAPDFLRPLTDDLRECMRNPERAPAAGEYRVIGRIKAGNGKSAVRALRALLPQQVSRPPFDQAHVSSSLT